MKGEGFLWRCLVLGKELVGIILHGIYIYVGSANLEKS